MTKAEFNAALLDLAIQDVTANGWFLDFVVSSSFELDWVGFNDDLDPGVYLHYKFYAAGKDYPYQGYMPINLDTFRGMFDE